MTSMMECLSPKVLLYLLTLGADVPAYPSNSCLTDSRLRSMTWDERNYHKPQLFKPERFLTPDGQLDPDVPNPLEAFGYGRRLCPGRHYAEDVLFLAISNILAAFTIEKPLDRDGNVIEPRMEFVGGTSRFVSF